MSERTKGEDGGLRIEDCKTRSTAILHSLSSIFVLLVISACGPTKQEIKANVGVEAYFAGDFRGAVRRLEPLAEKTDENFVLNNCRLGLAALAEYDLDT